MNISCTLPAIEAEIALGNYGASSVANFPLIVIRREPGIGSHAVTSIANDRKILMTPQNEPLAKRLTRIYFEDGLNEALNEAQHGTKGWKVTNFIVKWTKFLFEKSQQLDTFLRPRYDESKLIDEFSQARDYKQSAIRFMCYHRHVFRLAIAVVDDSIRIYSMSNTNIPILRNGQQKSITCMAWRPLCPSELAVGCSNGVILWKLDFSNNFRPGSQFQHLKFGTHYPVNSLEWNFMGTHLATACLNSADIIVWEVDRNRCEPIKRLGLPGALLRWSPNSQRLYSTTIGSVFRVWNTYKWTADRWTLPRGSVQSAAWSPCSNHLVFVTTEEPILYRLSFVDDHLYQTSSTPKQSFPIADFSEAIHGSKTIGGLAQSVCWDSSGKFIAVMFKATSSIAIYNTAIDRSTVHISPSFFISGDRIDDEFPSFICFQEKYDKNERVILTIGWSSGRVQYSPIAM